MIQQVLQDFGLRKNEVKVYLALLPMAKASSSTIGARSGLSRNTVRNIVRSLVKRGLAHEMTEGNTNFYRVEPPERIIHLLQEKKNELAQQQAQMNQFMGIFQAMQNPTLNCPSVKYYEGRDGIIEIYEDILETGEDVFCWTNFEKKMEILGKAFIHGYIPRRLEKNIKIYAIKAKTPKTIKHLEFQNLNREVHLVEKLPIVNGEIRIYGDKVAIITFSKQPIGFVFKSKEIVDVFKNIFQFSW